MKTIFAALMCLVMSIMSVPAFASGNQVIGLGADNCSFYNEMRQDADNRFHMVNWAQGFLSGFNIGVHLEDSSKSRLLPSYEVIESQLDQRCAQKPNELIVVILAGIYGQFAR